MQMKFPLIVSLAILLVGCAAKSSDAVIDNNLSVTVERTKYFAGISLTKVKVTWKNGSTERAIKAQKYGTITPDTDLTKIGWDVILECEQRPGEGQNCATKPGVRDRLITHLRQAEKEGRITFISS